jgi:hypothetical protein
MRHCIAAGARPLVAHKQQRHAAIHQLRPQGHSLTAISWQLGVCFRTVQRYAAVSAVLAGILTRCPELVRCAATSPRSPP